MPAVSCSKCATDLPEGAQFCLRCGEPVRATVAGTLPVAATATLGCSKCGTNLPEGAGFCPKCGKPVSLPPKKALPRDSSGVINSTPIDPNPIDPNPIDQPPPQLPGPRPTRRVVLLSLLGIILVAMVWAATSDNPFAQGMQDLAGWKHDLSILDAPFTVSAHNFRYYKFALPEGSMRVSIVGQFSATIDSHAAAGKDADSAIEVYVLSEPAFTVWQNGYATSTVYESGRVSQGKVEADLPAGAGIYYLVFSNKFAPKAAKSVNASVLLRYKKWLPESWRSAKDRFWNWLGL